eukprot:s1449_g1.t3
MNSLRSSVGFQCAKPYHVPEPPSAGSDDREGNSSAAMAPQREVPSESPGQKQRRRSRPQGKEQHVAGDRLPSTPSFGSPWQRVSRSPSPSEPQRTATAVQRAPNTPAVLMAGPVLSRTARPRTPAPAPAPAAVPASELPKSRRTRSPDQSLSPRVPTKRNEVRPRSLSPEMAKRLQKTAFR